MTASLNERDKMLAAEFAMGTVENDLRDEAQKRYDQDLAFRHEVDLWSERLVPMLDDVAQLQPSAQVWNGIELALNQNMPKKSGWIANLFSSKIALVSGALAVLVFVVGINYLPSFTSQPGPILTATLSGEQLQSAMIANYDSKSGKLLVTTNMQVVDQRDYELWIIADGQAAPISMGIVAPSGTAEMTLPTEITTLLTEGATLAISQEPIGGSPTGLPTGPVVAAGTLAQS